LAANADHAGAERRTPGVEEGLKPPLVYIGQLAWRLSLGLTQQQVADAYNQRWPAQAAEVRRLTEIYRGWVY
jgi:hypothetical protein